MFLRRRVSGTRYQDTGVLVERKIRPAWMTIAGVSIGAIIAAVKCVIDALSQ
jgi:hypothetical protein